MIKLVTSGEELDFLPADPFSARITALFDTYGAGQSFAMFWVQDNGKAAMSRIDGSVSLYASPDADFDELAEFLNAVGYSDIICDESIAKGLGFEIKASSYIVEYKNPLSSDESGILNDFDKKEIYALLCDCGFSMGDYGSFLADICSRLNKNTASMAAVSDKDGLCSCAFSLFNGRKSSLLGAVATRKSKRGRGFAGRLVTKLANECRGKVFLFCRNDGLKDFYGKYGFEVCGRWASL